MQCCFCGKQVESIEQAIDLGWYPDFWDGDVNYQGPVCQQCQDEHLYTDKTGEYVLKPEHILPPSAESVGLPRKPLAPRSSTGIRPKFSLGQVGATIDALKALSDSGQTPDFFLDRHVLGDWGEVCDEDKQLNDEALTTGGRLLSAYRTLRSERIWIITEAADDDGKRATTTILTPEEY